ncbi:hypothetical protein PPACK8108_LOCUS4455 [Phakopsora pachyrhizi]|uniref:Secreted protein n=1 Tax=Phakopsora pachyrhizi TaxID=170000 RepID=A0AAV0AMI7_PHAPC|nr:hypothetical protein PPACK8108_LOCUS4455 [Phakopsora pachyrhizi]
MRAWLAAVSSGAVKGSFGERQAGAWGLGSRPGSLPTTWPEHWGSGHWCFVVGPRTLRAPSVGGMIACKGHLNAYFWDMEEGNGGTNLHTSFEVVALVAGNIAPGGVGGCEHGLGSRQNMRYIVVSEDEGRQGKKGAWLYEQKEGTGYWDWAGQVIPGGPKILPWVKCFQEFKTLKWETLNAMAEFGEQKP